MPEQLPAELLDHLKSVWVAGQQLRITRDGEAPAAAATATPAAKPKPAARKPASREDVAPAAEFKPAPPAEFKPAPAEARPARSEARPTRAEHAQGPAAIRPAPARFDADENDERPAPPPKKQRVNKGEMLMQTYRIEVGHAHGVKPANIVGAIANEAGLEARHIGRIDIHDDYSIVDLPDGMPKDLMKHLKTVWVAGQQLKISHAADEPAAAGKSVAAAPPRSGGDRRVAEKQATGERPPSKFHKPDAAKKPHRKGPR